MATTIVHYTPAQNVTVKAASDLKAGTFDEIAGDVDGRNPVVKTATANATAFGVPAKDTKKGSHVIYRSGHIVEVAAQGAIAEGSAVKVATSVKHLQPVMGLLLVLPSRLPKAASSGCPGLREGKTHD